MGDDLPPLSAALECRQNSRWLCGARRQRASARVHLFSRDNEAEARQAKVPTKDEARRIAVNVGAVAQLLGKAD